MPTEVTELDGRSAHALAVACATFHERQPTAQLEQFTVQVQPVHDGTVQIVFVPSQAEDAKPTLGGRTALGRELSVWVSTDSYTVSKVSFAR